MSYSYPGYSEADLEDFASIVHSRYAKMCNGCFVDIELIVEASGIKIMTRRGNLESYVEAYVAKDPNFIVLPEFAEAHLEKYRFKVAEEWCHIVLEFDLLNSGKLPEGALAHQMPPEQHQRIENDAKYFARAVLMPRKIFAERFQTNVAKNGATSKSAVLINAVENLEKDFKVWYLTVSDRARDLKLLTHNESWDNFYSKIKM